jgi:hypothetical protein
LLTGAAGAAGLTALATGLGFTGFGFTREEVGFAGPPSGVCLTGAARGVCFLTPPIALWAKAGGHQTPPNAAATSMIATALFFMGPSPDCVDADHQSRRVHKVQNYCP